MRSSGGFQIVGTALIGRVLRFCRINFDAAPKLSAVLDADARRRDVTEDRAILLDFDAAARVEISDHLAVHNHVACVDFRVELRRSEEHTSELQSLAYLVCRLLLEKKKIT